MSEFYHYTLEKNIIGIRNAGIFPNHPYFTTTEYFDSYDAGQKLGVMAHNIEYVLKFKDDGFFRRLPDVPSTGRFTGGGNQYQHHSRPKPVAVRKITDRIWVNLM